MSIVNQIIEISTEVVANGGIILGMLIIILESFIPILPLSVFIALNVNAFGLVVGIILSWIATCIGCYISYKIFNKTKRKLLRKYLSNKTNDKIDRALTNFKNISPPKLAMIMTLPFVPAFLINILCGITHMNEKKFILSICVGKIFMVFFWGFVGKSFIESITDINTILILILLLLIAYILSKIVSHKAKID